MKRVLFLFILALAFPVLADEQSEKRQLISELLEVMDAKQLLQSSFSNLMMTLSTGFQDKGEDPPPRAEDIPEEYRAEWEAERKKEQEELRAFQESMFARIDYEKYFTDTYVPMLEKQFTASELRELIAFFKTKHGQKLARVLPEFGISVAGFESMNDAAEETQKEMQRAEAAKYPWRSTMADMRTIATAAEAYATDTNEYPKVDFDQLGGVLSPTYIRELPKADGWGTPYLWVSDGRDYRVVSAGADKRFEFGARQLQPAGPEPILSENLDADIIFQNGDFIQAPDLQFVTRREQ